MIEWIDTSRCRPPHRVTRPEQVEMLYNSFQQSNGWGLNQPSLLGYTLDGGVKNDIQLLSGSHRWAAAKIANIKIPVVIKSFKEVYSVWGNLFEWKKLFNVPYIERISNVA